MIRTWAAAAAAVSLSVTGTAVEARSYLFTVTLDSQLIYPPGEERYLVPMDPIVFQQTWTLGDYPGTPPVVNDPGCDAPCVDIGAEAYTTAELHNTGYTAANWADFGLGPPPLGYAYSTSGYSFYPPTLTSILTTFLVSERGLETPDGAGGTRVQNIFMAASANIPGPGVPSAVTNDTAAAALTHGGGYRFFRYDSGCPDGSCAASIQDYIGTFTATALSVPEPSTWALMILGFGAAGARLRSRRRAAPGLPARP